MYDPTTQQWQDQITTGDIPGESANGCIVGAEGDNGTYEIFLYGGQVPGDAASTITNGEVYVLSLPSFNWQKQYATGTTGRYMMSCNVVGKRQMVVVGGIVIPQNVDWDTYNFGAGEPDPWDQAIGIFDLTEMAWKSSYDASASPYITPDAVKSFYTQHGRYPAQWDSGVVEDWFKNPGKSYRLLSKACLS